ncbi:aspartic proteinase CDR1-like [Eucalyptus grandis]|uniref:aspartic proteinase CDR1-like n=1 Tax=Eucalyptus grandis TaxID=71139 RepID=UPI00192EFD80|nr:aspartic proteinase CDR1-like [Eucalyptus grandis]
MEASLKFHSLLSFALVLALSIPCESASGDGFTLELVHRESQNSPFYNPADTRYQHVTNAIRRSISRVKRLDPSSVNAPGTPSAVIVSNNGEYLMNVSLGTPKSSILGIADTGSDLIWTQCAPCTDCFKQASPIFEPNKSSTYKAVSCRASQCGVIDQTSCGGGQCQYSYSYGDSSYTIGNLATETFALGSSSGGATSFPRVVFGCGRQNGGNFDDKVDGIIGLGGGPASLVTQLGTATGGRFSYCLVPFYSDGGKSSKLNFGADAAVAGRGTVSTPLIQKEPETFYYLTLEAVSVGETRIEFSSGSSPSEDEGNIIIDSGTTLTLLPQDFYKKIEAAVVKQVKLTRTADPTQVLSLCYSATTDEGLGIPPVTFHFKGADVELNPGNSFVRVAENVICFAVSSGDLSIYGNLSQMDYLVGYDTQNSKLSFKPVDCSSN